MSADLKAKLAQLKELHSMGLLTDADFQKQKDALLATAMGTTPAIKLIHPHISSDPAGRGSA